MPIYNFDQIIDRHGTHSVKYDGVGGFHSDYQDIIPLWIADMDFATPPFVIEAIKDRLKHPILGYSIIPTVYYDAICSWFGKRYGFIPEREQIEFVPGVVSGIYKLLECLTNKGDKVLITPPVYTPFAEVIRHSEREVVEAPLVLRNERYELDWDKLRRGMQEAKAFILCHPHNPGGRVWRTDELQRIAQMALHTGTLVISDEIHADLTHRGFKHTPFPSVSSEATKVGITLMAPSKAFNMPGVVGSHLYIKSDELREQIFSYIQGNGLAMGDCFTYDAIAAAYTHGVEWLEQCLEYIETNITYVSEFTKEHIPKLRMITPEASYLIFLDCRELGFSTTDALHRFFIEKAGLYLNEGVMFGTGGDFFMRLNVGCPRPLLQEAMHRLEKAVTNLKQ